MPVRQGLQVDRRGGAGQPTDVHHVPIDRGSGQALGEGVAGDVVEDHVRALPIRRGQRRLGQVLLSGDDHRGSAQAREQVRLGCGPGGRDHRRRPKCLGDLDPDRADAGGRAGDEHALRTTAHPRRASTAHMVRRRRSRATPESGSEAFRPCGGRRRGSRGRVRSRRAPARTIGSCQILLLLLSSPAVTSAQRFSVKNDVSLSNGIRSVLSYRSTWFAPGMVSSSLGSAAAA